MSFEVKLGLFWAFVFGIQWAIKRFPHSMLARCLMTWNGPFPSPDETRSHYYLRKARFALGWLVQITVIIAGLYLFARLSPEFSKSDALLVSMFALALGMGTAMLGVLLSLLTSAKAAWFGPTQALSSRNWRMAAKWPDSACHQRRRAERRFIKRR